MTYRTVYPCAFSAIDVCRNPSRELTYRRSRYPSISAHRRLNSYSNDTMIVNGKVSKTKLQAIDMLTDCFPFPTKKRTDGPVLRRCNLYYWCPQCWIRHRVLPAYNAVSNYLMDAKGNPRIGREHLTACVIQQTHHGTRTEIPMDEHRRTGFELVSSTGNSAYDWSGLLPAMRYSTNRDGWEGSIDCYSAVISINHSMDSGLQPNLVYRVTPFASTIIITAKDAVDDILEAAHRPSDFYETQTAAASHPDLFSIAQQVAIFARYPNSWYNRDYWPILPDVIKALSSQRLYATFGCLRKDNNSNDKSHTVIAGVSTVVHTPKAVRIPAVGPNSRFAPKPPPGGEVNDSGDDQA